MNDTVSKLHAVSLLLAAALLVCAGPSQASENEYALWVQAGYRDFFHGEFVNTCADLDPGSILLKRIEHGSEYCREGEFVSPVYNADREFDALFVSWIAACEGKDRIRVSIRVGDGGRNFTEWTEVTRESETVFTSNHRCIQYRVRLTSGSPRTSPEFKSIAIYHADLYDGMKNIVPEPVGYTATLDPPTIVEREEWGAAAPSSPYTPQDPQAIILHHSYIPTVSQYTGAATIRGIQNYHMTSSSTGWIDIGYHFLIGPDGKIYRGRPEKALGSHTIPNSNKIGICCIGDFDPGKDPLPQATYDALKKLIPYIASKYRISRSQLYGHRDFSPKTCPGETVYLKIPELKNDMLRALGK